VRSIFGNRELLIQELAKGDRIIRLPSPKGKEMISLRSNGASKPKGSPGKSRWPSSGGGDSGANRSTQAKALFLEVIS